MTDFGVETIWNVQYAMDEGVGQIHNFSITKTPELVGGFDEQRLFNALRIVHAYGLIGDRTSYVPFRASHA